MERRAEELKDRQAQLGTLLNIPSEELRGLEFCHECGGVDPEWTDWSLIDIETCGLDLTIEETIDYRSYLAGNSCQACGGTGFEGGSFKLSAEEWTTLGVVIE